MPTNGCEIDTDRTSAHCGRCGAPCPIGQGCSAGVCLSSDVVDLYPSDLGFYARRDSGGGAVWGENVNGTLGAGDTATHTVAGPALLDDALLVSLGHRHGCA